MPVVRLLTACVVLLAVACGAPQPTFRPDSQVVPAADLRVIGELARFVPQGDPGASLRVVSLNIKLPQTLAELEQRYGGLTAAGLDATTDVWLLQEIETIDSGALVAAKWLADQMSLNYVYAPARSTGDGDTHGLAILSRYPISEVDRVWLPRYKLAWNSRNRIAIAATIRHGEHSLRVYNVHLDTKLNFADRLNQLTPVVRAAMALPHALIGGDFNSNNFQWAGRAVPIGYDNQARRLDSALAADGFAAPFADLGGTSALGMRLDGIYLRGLQARDATIRHTPGDSDHSALDVEVAW